MREGIRLGVDVGTVRVGVARSDGRGILATPLETVQRQGPQDADIRRILSLARELDALEIVVGLPLSLSGAHTASTRDAVGFATSLRAAGTVPVRLVDERLSTVSAQSALRASGKSSRTTRSVIDQAAATVILQHALDSERSSGRPPGRAVDAEEGSAL